VQRYGQTWKSAPLWTTSETNKKKMLCNKALVVLWLYEYYRARPVAQKSINFFCSFNNTL
jgi:hypothetical protein